MKKNNSLGNRLSVKSFIAILLCICPLVAHGAPKKKTPPSGLYLLRKVLVNDGLVPYEGRQMVELSSGRHTEATITQEIHPRYNYDYIRYVMPTRVANRVIINEGNLHWEYDPKMHLAIRHIGGREKPAPSQIAYILHLINVNYFLKVHPRPVNVVGRACWILEIDPKLHDRYRRVWWVDGANGFVLRRDIYNTTGEMISSSSYTSIHYHPKVKMAIFHFTPPQGTRIITKAPLKMLHSFKETVRTAPKWAHIPQFLGDGFVFQSAQYVNVKRLRSLHLQYFDGICTLSVIQVPSKFHLQSKRQDSSHVRVNGRRGILVEKSGYRIISWYGYDCTISMVGEVSTRSMLALAHKIP